MLHELVHAIEPRDNYKQTLTYKSRSLNEALTQYLSYEAYHYYKKDELDYETIVNNIKKDNCMYNCMLPLVGILKESALWDDILDMKIKNEYSILESKIGKYAYRIYDVFDEVYDKQEKKELSDDIFNKYKEELREIIKDVKNDFYRCNKNY
jgi:hypothetical protein